MICDRGLKVHFSLRENSHRRRLIDPPEIRSFLWKVISSVCSSEPRYWLLVEIGNYPLFAGPDPETMFDALESSIVAESKARLLLRGDSFSRFHDLYVGDCPAVLSVMKPRLADPHKLLEHYSGQSPRDLVERMSRNDIYFYCYEWNWLTFFAHDATLDEIKQISVAEGLPITERVVFEDQ